MSRAEAEAAEERWCPNCNRMVATDHASEHCPDCGQSLDAVPTGEQGDSAEDADAPPKAPWHFKVLLVGTVGYLIYRLVWFIQWLSQHH